MLILIRRVHMILFLKKKKEGLLFLKYFKQKIL